MEADPLTVTEVEAIAKSKLPRHVYDYYAGGGDEELSLRRNTGAFRRILIRPRVLRDVSSIDTGTSLLGARYPMPFGIAPSAMQKLAGGEGELDVARAAARFGLNMSLSTSATTSLEDVKKTFTACRQEQGLPESPLWFQLYLTTDLDRCIPLIRRAEEAGYQALVLTVDTPVLGNRLHERKVPLILPPHIHLANLEPPRSPQLDGKERKPTGNRILLDARTSQEAAEARKLIGGSLHSASLTWATVVEFLRKTTSMKIILKGIMTPEDALLAVEHGVDAIVVSNHGGRQLDGVPSTLEVLPDIAAAVQGKIPVLFDGGIRHGSDVFKAIALGADFVLIGRQWLWLELVM